MKLTVVLTLAALMVLAFALDASAQRQPSGAPQVDLGGPTGYPQGQQWSGPPRVDLGQPRSGGNYFQPTPYPYQGSYSRRWRGQLGETWGNTPYNQGVPQNEYQYGFPPQGPDRIFVSPYRWPTYRCWGSRCRRNFPPFR